MFIYKLKVFDEIHMFYDNDMNLRDDEWLCISYFDAKYWFNKLVEKYKAEHPDIEPKTEQTFNSNIIDYFHMDAPENKWDVEYITISIEKIQPVSPGEKIDI